MHRCSRVARGVAEMRQISTTQTLAPILVLIALFVIGSVQGNPKSAVCRCSNMIVVEQAYRSV